MRAEKTPLTVAVERFTGFRAATAEEVPAAVAVLGPFPVVRLAGTALDDRSS